MSAQTQTRTDTETGEVIETDAAMPAREDALDERGRIDLRRYLIKVQGGRQYLPVQARIIAFRHEFPDWSIETEAVEINWQEKRATFRAVIRDDKGSVRASGYKSEDVKGFGDFCEKAETGAVGRALNLLGLGTEYATDMNELDGRQGERFVDSPREARPQGQSLQPAATDCAVCGGALNQAQAFYSVKIFDRPLCLAHQKEAREAQKQITGQAPADGPKMAANGRDTAGAVAAVQIKIREERERIWGKGPNAEALYREWLEWKTGDRSLKNSSVMQAEHWLGVLRDTPEYDPFDEHFPQSDQPLAEAA